MLPKITELQFNIEETEALPKQGKLFSFDFNKGDFVIKDGKLVEVEDIEALKVWIEKALLTERFRFRVYDNVEYGVTLEDLIGSNFPRNFIEVEIKREVTSTLIKHPLINNVVNWTFTRDGSFMRVSFKVILVDGSFEQEVRFNV